MGAYSPRPAEIRVRDPHYPCRQRYIAGGRPACAGVSARYTLSGVFAENDTVTLQPFHTLHDCRYMMYWLTMSPEQYAAHQERMQADEQALLALDRRTVDAVRAVSNSRRPTISCSRKTPGLGVLRAALPQCL